jgi:hypothetical protein
MTSTIRGMQPVEDYNPTAGNRDYEITPMEVAIRTMKANSTCIACQSPKGLVVMPSRYEELKAEKAS